MGLLPGQLPAVAAALIEASSDAVLVVDGQDRVLFWNNAAEALLGYTAAEVLGTVPSLWPPGLERERAAIEENLHERGRVTGWDSVRLHKDGRLIPVSISAFYFSAEAASEPLAGIVMREASARRDTAGDAEARLHDDVEVAGRGLETASVLFVQLDAEGRVVRVNQMVEEVTGYSREELTGHNRGEFVGLAGPEGTPGTFENTIVTKSGGERMIRWRNSEVRGLDGRTGLISFGRDVTEERRTQEALSESEAKYRSLVETAQELVWQCDAEGRFTYLNPAWEATHGYAVAEMLGRGFGEFQRPEVFERDLAEFARHMAGGSVVGYETTHIAKDGHEITLIFNVIPLLAADGTVVGTQGTAIDVTARKQAEREKEQFLRFFRLSGDAMCIADPFGCFLRVNPAMLRMTGYDEQELISRPFIDFIADEDRARTTAEMALQVAERPSIEFENRYVRKDGSQLLLSWNAYFDTSDGVTYATARDITARRQAEIALMESQERLHAVVEGTSDAVFVKDREGRYVLLNAAAAAFLGRTPEEVIGRDDAAVLDPKDAEQVRQRDRAVMDDGRTVTYEERVGTPVGPRVFLTTKGPLRDAEGKVAGLFGISRDITERKAAEEALARAEERFRMLAENAPDLVYRFRTWPEPGFEYVSPSATRMVGYTPEEHYADPELGFKLAHPDDREKLAALMAAEGATGPVTFRWVAKDGRLVWTEQQNVFVRDASGRVVAIEGIARDITERKLAEDQLNELALRNETILQMASDGLHIVRADGSVVEVNDAFCRALGYTREEVLRLRVQDWDARWSPDEIEAEIAARMREPAVFETVHRRKDGTLIDVEINARGISLGGEMVVFASARDITERKRAEREREEAARERLALTRRLLEAERNESIGMLAGGIAHDFNNLLVLIVGNTALALLDLEEGQPARACIEEIQAASQRAAGLARSLLAYAGQARLVPLPTDLNALVEEATGNLLASSVPGIVVETSLAPNLAPVLLDVAQVRHSLAAILTNAAEATTPPGQVVVRTGHWRGERRDLDSSYTAADDFPGGDCVFFEVRDNGTGMDEKTLGRVYEPFFSTRFLGRGLGMAAVLGVVRGHHGAISIVSAPGAGTTVRVLLPLGR